MSGKAETVRSARWRRLREIIGSAGVRWQWGTSYSVKVEHPRGPGAGHLDLRVSESAKGFVRARSIGPMRPLDTGKIFWAVTITEAEVLRYATDYASTGDVRRLDEK